MTIHISIQSSSLIYKQLFSTVHLPRQGRTACLPDQPEAHAVPRTIGAPFCQYPFRRGCLDPFFPRTRFGAQSWLHGAARTCLADWICLGFEFRQRVDSFFQSATLFLGTWVSSESGMKRVAAGPTGPDQALNLEVWNGASARCWLRIFVCLAERQCLCDLLHLFSSRL